MAEQKLSEEHRKKLTAILEKLHTSGASDDDIRDTVRDYKAKYSGATDQESVKGPANTSFLDTTGTILKNAAKAAPGGVMSGAVDTVAGLAHQAGNIAGLMNPIRLARTIANAPETIKSAVDYAKTIPGRLAEWPSNIVADVKAGATQPEKYGTDVGRSLGYGVGSGLAQEGIGYLPEAAAAAGKVVEATKPAIGATGRGAVRLADSKAMAKLAKYGPNETIVGLATGNVPLAAGGVASMAGPAALRKTGQLMQDFAESGARKAPIEAVPNVSGYEAGPIPEAPGENIIPPNPTPVEPHAPSVSGYEAPKQGPTSFADAVRIKADELRSDALSREPYKASTEPPVPSTAAVPPSGQVPPEAVLDSMGVKYGQNLAVNPRTGVPSEYSTPDNPEWFMSDHERMMADMERNSPQMLGSSGEASVRPGEYPPSSQTVGEIPASYGSPEQGSYDLGNVNTQPDVSTPANVGPEPSMDELMANRLKAAQDRLPIRPSRSKSSPKVGKILTTGDIDALKGILEANPGIDMAAAAEMLQRERAVRSAAYRTNAGMDRAGVR